MKYLYVVIILLILPALVIGQKIKKTITTYEYHKNENYIQQESLKETFDKKGRVIRATYTNLYDDLKRQKEIHYEYKKKKTIAKTYYLSKDVQPPVLCEIKTTILQEGSNKTNYEKIRFEKINKEPFFYHSELEEFESLSIEEVQNGNPLDSVSFGIKSTLKNKENYKFILATKEYPSPINGIFKAIFRYNNFSKNSETLFLSSAIFFEKRKDGTVNKHNLTIANNPLRFRVDYSEHLNNENERLDIGSSYKYEFDKHGNWTTRTYIYNNNPHSRKSREIIYY